MGGVIASVIVMITGLFLPHGHTLGINSQTTVQTDVTVTPSVSPTDTPSVTPSDTPSVTPSDTPSISPTITPTPSATISPTVTPSTSPSPSPTQQGDGDKDDLLNLNADAHAVFGLMNAAFHHEQNEERFNQKHGDRE